MTPLWLISAIIKELMALVAITGYMPGFKKKLYI